MLLTVWTMAILVLVLTESQGRHNSSCFSWEPPSFSLQAPERMFPNGLIFHVTEREVLSPSLILAFLFVIWLGGGPLRGPPVFRASGRIKPFPGASDGAPANPRASLGLQGKQRHFSGGMSISALLWGWTLCTLLAIQLLGPARHSGCHCAPRGRERERVWGSGMYICPIPAALPCFLWALPEDPGDSSFICLFFLCP